MVTTRDDNRFSSVGAKRSCTQLHQHYAPTGLGQYFSTAIFINISSLRDW